MTNDLPFAPELSEGHTVHSSISDAIDYVRQNSKGSPLSEGVQVTINFHPDALHQDQLMIDTLAQEGVYRSQFETGSSNGGLSAHPGGDRWRWESRIFGTAYDNADPALRPKYGAMNYRGHVTGGSPRFGSAHLRLRPHVLARSTFCYPDSHLDPVYFGVADRMSLVALVERFAGGRKTDFKPCRFPFRIQILTNGCTKLDELGLKVDFRPLPQTTPYGWKL